MYLYYIPIPFNLFFNFRMKMEMNKCKAIAVMVAVVIFAASIIANMVMVEVCVLQPFGAVSNALEPIMEGLKNLTDVLGNVSKLGDKIMVGDLGDIFD